MQREYLEKIKESNGWIFDKNFKANLICTDDADSVFSCLMLMHYYPERFEIGFFYDFNSGLYQKIGIDESLPIVGVDLSHPSMRCISNHLTQLRDSDSVNPNDINLNIIDSINARNYHSKYNLNTLLLVASLCNHEFKDKISMLVALLPDSAFMARFQPEHYKDRRIQEKYLKILGYEDMLEIQDRAGRERFYMAQKALNIKSKAWVTENGIEFKKSVDIGLICDYLGIDYDSSDLEGLFYLVEEHRSYVGSSRREYNKSNMFSFVVTRKHEVKYSMRI